MDDLNKQSSVDQSTPSELIIPKGWDKAKFDKVVEIMNANLVVKDPAFRNAVLSLIRKKEQREIRKNDAIIQADTNYISPADAIEATLVANDIFNKLKYPIN